MMKLLYVQSSSLTVWTAAASGNQYFYVHSGGAYSILLGDELFHRSGMAGSTFGNAWGR